ACSLYRDDSEALAHRVGEIVGPATGSLSGPGRTLAMPGAPAPAEAAPPVDRTWALPQSGAASSPAPRRGRRWGAIALGPLLVAAGVAGWLRLSRPPVRAVVAVAPPLAPPPSPDASETSDAEAPPPEEPAVAPVPSAREPHHGAQVGQLSV